MANQLPSVQHIVQLMLENRSFDHMLGFLYAPGNVSPTGQPFEGLTGNESNADASGNKVTVYQIDTTTSGAYFMPGADPGEGYANTNQQLFGTGNPPSPPVATNTGFVTNFADAISYDQRSGRSVQAGTTASQIMGMFTPAGLPVLSSLAAGFAVCDHWYSSAPTETFPNRAFVARHRCDITEGPVCRSLVIAFCDGAQYLRLYGRVFWRNAFGVNLYSERHRKRNSRALLRKFLIFQRVVPVLARLKGVGEPADAQPKLLAKPAYRR